MVNQIYVQEFRTWKQTINYCSLLREYIIFQEKNNTIMDISMIEGLLDIDKGRLLDD